MNAEILESQPLSGDFEEHDFMKSGADHALWVKFLDSEFLEWVGVFSLGDDWRLPSIVFPLNNQGLFLVIVRGQGYFVDPDLREIVSKTEWDRIQAIVYSVYQSFEVQ